MRKIAILVILVLTILTVSLAAGCGSNSQNSSGEKAQESKSKVLYIGSVVSQSGASAGMGTESMRGQEYAIKKINEAGGLEIGGQKYEIKLKSYDDGSRPENSAAMAQKLIENDGIKFIFTPAHSSGTLAMEEVTDKAGVLTLVTVSAAPAATRPEFEYVFRNLGTAKEYALTSTIFAMDKLKAKKYALFSRNDDWGRSAAQASKDMIKKLGAGEVVLEEYFDPGTNDFYSLLTKAKSAKADVYFVAAIHEDGIPFVKQARELGISTPIVGAFVWSSPAFANAVVGSKDIYSYSTAETSETPEIAKYKEDFKKVMGEESQTFDKVSYDMMMLLFEAMKQAGTVEDINKIRDNLRAINYKGVLGDYSFNKIGQASTQININRLEDGKVRMEMEVKPEQLKKYLK